MPTPRGNPFASAHPERELWVDPELTSSSDLAFTRAAVPGRLESEELRELRLLERENYRLLMQLKRRRLEQT